MLRKRAKALGDELCGEEESEEEKEKEKEEEAEEFFSWVDFGHVKFFSASTLARALILFFLDSPRRVDKKVSDGTIVKFVVFFINIV